MSNIETATADELIAEADKVLEKEAAFIKDMNGKTAFKAGYYSATIRHLVRLRNDLQGQLRQSQYKYQGLLNDTKELQKQKEEWWSQQNDDEQWCEDQQEESNGRN